MHGSFDCLERAGPGAHLAFPMPDSPPDRLRAFCHHPRPTHSPPLLPPHTPPPPPPPPSCEAAASARITSTNLKARLPRTGRKLTFSPHLYHAGLRSPSTSPIRSYRGSAVYCSRRSALASAPMPSVSRRSIEDVLVDRPRLLPRSEKNSESSILTFDPDRDDDEPQSRGEECSHPRSRASCTRGWVVGGGGGGYSSSPYLTAAPAYDRLLRAVPCARWGVFDRGPVPHDPPHPPVPDRV